MSRDCFSPCFLGPYAENDEILEKTVVEFLRDHVYWRRNFHPEDPPPISTAAALTPEYQAFITRMRRELHLLSAALKRSVPFSSPRYIGHMVSDLLLPGLIAQITALPYNPNNVVDDAAPVTVDLELDVGLQLARMFGYPADETAQPCAFGHLTGGGTVANYEALVLLRAMRYFPLAARAAALATGFPVRLDGEPIDALSDWQLFNLPLDTVQSLHTELQAALSAHGDAVAARFARALAAERVESMGLVGFHARHPELKPPLVLAPATAHYSWEKSMKLLGLGTAQLVEVAQRGMRLDPAALDAALRDAAATRQPVLAVVGILGTTEFGTIDPIDRIVALRDEWQPRGLAFGVHVDAAWGGYLASMFRGEDGRLLPHAEVRREFSHFPSTETHAAFAALSETDSITVDPHKLGYVPYGAGAFVCRDARRMDFVAQDARYVFNGTSGSGFRDKFRALGRYALEGSRSGASAAAVYVTHRTLPLDHRHFGRLQAATIHAAEYFADRAVQLAADLADVATLIVPIVPDSNLICLAFNPLGNRSLPVMNRFTEAICADLRIDRSQALQTREFFGSSTRLHPQAIGSEEGARILRALNIDPDSFRAETSDTTRQADSILILRHTLMNPWLIDETNGVNYIDLYCEYLERLIREKLTGSSRTTPAPGIPPPGVRRPLAGTVAAELPTETQ